LEIGIIPLNRDMSFSEWLNNSLIGEKERFIELDSLEKEMEDVMNGLL
jgi:hypothetical protein